MIIRHAMQQRESAPKITNHQDNPLSSEQDSDSPVNVAASSEPKKVKRKRAVNSDSPDKVAASSEPKKVKRKVGFVEIVPVMLIPSIQEYKDAGIWLQIWPDTNEYKAYQADLGATISTHLINHGLFSTKENMKHAMNALYRQPDTHENTAINGAPNAEARVINGFNK